MVQVVSKSKDYRLLVVAPNTHYHFPLTMPHAIIPGQLGDDKNTNGSRAPIQSVSNQQV